MKSEYRMSSEHPNSDPTGARACRFPELDRWIDRGGVMPTSLVEHALACDACAERIRRINRVNAGLTLLGAQPVPIRSVSAANQRAMRMLRVTVRRSEAAKRLLKSRPRLSLTQRVQLQMTRATLTAAAAGLMIVLRVGALAGWERVEADGERLALAHWERHVDPTGEWMGPPPVA